VISRLQSLGVVVTCVIAALTYAGAVTTVGMAFVLAGVVGAALFGSVLASRGLFGAALVLGGGLVLAWSEIVNIWSGIGDGPAARSTAVACTCTLIAVVVARSASPALFLLPVAGSVIGALLLGAGSEVRSVAVLTAVSAALTLGSIERSRRNWAEPPRRGPLFPLLLLAIGAIAVACVLLQVQRDSRPPEALLAGRLYPHIKPPWSDPLGTVTNKIGGHAPGTGKTSPPPSAGQRTKPPTHQHRVVPHKKAPPPSQIWLYVLLGVLVVLLAIAGRLLAVRLAWRRLRRRLASGAPAEQITGAWAWMRIRLDTFRLPLAAAASPDLVVAGVAGSGLPPEVFRPLQTLAAATTTAAFAGAETLGADDVTGAWEAAGEADESAHDTVSRLRRAWLAFRGPASQARSR
jgi:hypothetical protein